MWGNIAGLVLAISLRGWAKAAIAPLIVPAYRAGHRRDFRAVPRALCHHLTKLRGVLRLCHPHREFLFRHIGKSLCRHLVAAGIAGSVANRAIGGLCFVELV